MSETFGPAMLEPGQAWYVVHSAPRKELYAAANLEAQGFRPFLPRLRKTVRHARRSRTTLAPLFPRYLFIALDVERDRWRSVLGTFGVSHMIMGGERPKPVPAGVVERLADAADDVGLIDDAPALHIGQRVRFASGPFADLVGRLVALDDRDRVGVLLTLLGGERVITTTPDLLLPAAP